MIYLTLFLTFLKIGAVSFGGGYGMISLIRETVLENAWLTEEEFLNFIAVAESTPGPLAVNMATFIGSAQAGFLGALVATLGVILPSFVIILIIAALIKNLLKYAGVKSVLSGIRPTIIITLILNTGNVLSVGFEKVYLMQNSVNYGVSEIISTYVYKVGIEQAQFSFSTAVGLFNSVVNCVILFAVNWIAGRVSETSLF